MEAEKEGELIRKESFSITIDFLLKKAAEKDVEVTHAQIADSLYISIDQYNTYYGSDDAPAELFPLLRAHYPDYLGRMEFVNISFTVAHEAPATPDPSDLE